MASSRGWWPIGVTVLALVAVNVASNRLVPHGLYVPFALAVAAALVAFAHRVDGRSLDDLGLARRHVPAGLRWGAVPAAVVLVAYLVAFALPATHDVFLDDRAADLSLGGALVAALVRVPLGTVVLEEVAFRSVLPALLAARTRIGVAVLASAVLFGLWHVLPALGLETVNPVTTDTVGTLPGWVTVAGSVVATTAVGVGLWWLRARSASVVAPMVLHWSTNGLGYLFAWWAWQR